MRRVTILAFAAGVFVVASLAVFVSGSASSVIASHGVKETHVHDDFYHPAGTFLVSGSTDHTLAQAACQAATPDPECTTVVHAGDSVRWVAPPPLAANVHTVTECTDATFSTCGAGVSSANPIEDSGVRAQPGWPYQVQFDDPGTYYYRCEIHPGTMRGVVTVQNPSVGGIVDLVSEDGGAPQVETAEEGVGLTLYLLVGGVAAALALAIGGLAARRVLARRRIG